MDVGAVLPRGDEVVVVFSQEEATKANSLAVRT